MIELHHLFDNKTFLFNVQYIGTVLIRTNLKEEIEGSFIVTKPDNTYWAVKESYDTIKSMLMSFVKIEEV